MVKVFISHDNRDKAAIKPFVHALFAEGVDLFVDRPVEIDIDPTDPRVDSIRMNESWQDGLIRGLEGADIVLAFWTPNSVGKSETNKGSVILNEVFFADARSKLRSVLLADDPGQIGDVIAARPVGLKDYQSIDLTGVDRANIAADANFLNLVAQLRQSAPADAKPERGTLRPRFRAKLVNRQKTVTALLGAGENTLLAAIDQASGPRAHGFIVMGRDDDRLEFIGDRFIAHDGADCFDVLPRDTAGRLLWAGTREWKDHRMKSLDDDVVTADSFGEHLTRQHGDLRRKKPLRDTAGQYPLMATIRVRYEAIEDDPAGIIGAWLAAWESELREPIDLPVLPVLYIGYTAEEPGFFSSLFSKPAHDTLQTAVKTALDAAPGRFFDASIAPQLGTIDWSIANDWVRDHFADDLQDTVDDIVTELFPKKGKSPAYRMSEFYTTITRKPPFTSEQRA